MAERLLAATRAQSEVLGFVLVFAMVVTAIGLVTATGFAGLEDAREAEAAGNAVRGVDILADNVDDIVRGRSPHRGTELGLADATLVLGDPVTVAVSGRHATDPAEDFAYDFEVRPIEYVVGDDTAVVYVAGAIIRDQPDGEVMLQEPTLVFTDSEVVLPVVQTRALGPVSVGGTHTVNVRTGLAETTVLVAGAGPYEVTYRVTSPRADAWETYFRTLPGATVSRAAGSDTVAATIVTDRAYVTVVRIDVTFE